MPRLTAYKQPSAVSGLSVQDIMNIDPVQLARFSEKELQQYTQRLVSAANKRIVRLEKSGVDLSINPALRELQNAGVNRFSTKGKNLNQLRKEFNLVSSFLTNKTSSVSGYKKFQKDFKKAFKRSFDDVLQKISIDGASDEYIQDIYKRIVERVQDVFPAFVYESQKKNVSPPLGEDITKKIYDMIESGNYSVDEITEKILSDVESLYIKNQNMVSINDDDFITIKDSDFNAFI